MIIKFIKFGFVGFSGLCVDFGLTYILKEIFRSNKFIANAVGFTAAVLSNYFLNRIWTFQNTDPAVFSQLSLFLAVSLLGLLFNTGVLYYFNQCKKYNFYISKGFAILIVFCWNFLANTFVTFA